MRISQTSLDLPIVCGHEYRLWALRGPSNRLRLSGTSSLLANTGQTLLANLSFYTNSTNFYSRRAYSDMDLVKSMKRFLEHWLRGNKSTKAILLLYETFATSWSKSIYVMRKGYLMNMSNRPPVDKMNTSDQWIDQRYTANTVYVYANKKG